WRNEFCRFQRFGFSYAILFLSSWWFMADTKTPANESQTALARSTKKRRREKTTNDQLISQKTPGARASDWPPASARAHLRRACQDVGVLGSHGQPVHLVAKTARIPFRFGDALWARRSWPSHLPDQHNGHAHAEPAGRSPCQSARHAAGHRGR